MRLFSLIPLLGITVVTPAIAQEPTVLWRGLTAGMTKEQVAEVLPEKEIDLLPDCRTVISPRFHNNRLVSVSILPKWILSKNSCIEPMTSSLVEKYGEANRTVENRPGNKFKAAEIYDVYFWIAGNIEVDYRTQIGGKSWSLTYRPLAPSAPKKRIEGL